MPAVEEQAGPRICPLEGRGVTVEFSAAALREILQASLDGFLSFPFGGLEAGGVLFGAREGPVLRVVTSRPVACEHAQGPGYVLSNGDEGGLRELLETSADPALAGLVPLGWYHSHTRGSLVLSATDLELHRRWFPEPWQVAVVLMPRYSKPTRIGLYLGCGDGRLPEAPDHEFEMGPAPVAKPTAARDPRRPAAAPVPSAPPAVPEAGPSPLPAPEPPPPEAPPVAEAAPVTEAPPPLEPEVWEEPRRRWFWPAVAIALVLLSAGLFLPGLWRQGPGTPPLALRLVETGGRLDIRWDAAASAVRQARGGVLEITDGLAEVVFPLDAKSVQAGSWSMVRQSPEVRVRLRVHGPQAEPIEESAQFLGPPPAARPPAGIPEPLAPKEVAPEAIAKLRAELESQLAEKSAVDRRLKALERLPEPVREAAPPPVVPAKPKPPARRTFQPPVTAARRGPAQTLGLPEIPEAQAAPGTALVQAGRLPEAPPPPAAVPVAPSRTEAAKPAPAPGTAVQLSAPTPQAPPAAAQSGRLIWTGVLPRNGVLTIEQGRPSSGHLTGALPGGPCRVGASPAEFAGGGLTVFSANPRYARAPLSEPPGPRNGWNRTLYRYDPRLAQDLVVVEAPSAQNGWSRLVLRSGERPLAVLVLDWELIP